jgi:hypothetical protein
MLKRLAVRQAATFLWAVWADSRMLSARLHDAYDSSAAVRLNYCAWEELHSSTGTTFTK